MNPIKKEKPKKLHPNAQTNSSHDISKKQDKELITFHKDLTNSKVNIKEPEKMKKELETLSKELQVSKTKMEELEKQNKKLDALSRELEKKKKEIALLHKELKNANTTIVELKKQDKEHELHLKEQEKIISVREEHIPKQKEEETDSVRLSKETFHIDFYLREGNYYGKVSHVLRDSKPIPIDEQKKEKLEGIDYNAIKEFINKCLPQQKESTVSAKLLISEPKNSQKEVYKLPLKIAAVKKFALVREGLINKEKSIPHGIIFQLSLSIDSVKSTFKDSLPYFYNISVYGKRMGGSYKQLLGKAKGEITTADEFTANVHCDALSVGLYRFMAFGTIVSRNNEKDPVIQFHENNIFRVA